KSAKLQLHLARRDKMLSQGILRIPVTVVLFACVLYVPSTHALSSEANRFIKLQADAEQGSISAELELAARYLAGNGVDQDTNLAAHWYEKAAQHGNPEAANQIGYFYQVGLGVPVDFNRALRW